MEGESPNRRSIGSVPKRSSASSRGQHQPSSSSSSFGCKEFLRKFVDSEILTENLQDWFLASSQFDVPFNLTELQNFDYALEGVSFQQLVRMPSALHASTSDSIEATAHLAIEDFLHAGAKGLWETFWGHDSPMPFSVASVHSTSSKFYPAEEAIASGKLEGLCATALFLKNQQHSHGKWDQILELALLRPDIVSVQNRQELSQSAVGEALFFALRVLLSRSLSRSSAALRNSSCVYILPVDSQYGGVVTVEGDVKRLKFDVNNVYECAAEWIKLHAKITVSSVDRIWNKLGNANWVDIGALHILLATFHSLIQYCGKPTNSVEDLLKQRGSRIQNRRKERELGETYGNGDALFRFQKHNRSSEIVEVDEGPAKVRPERIEIGSVLWVEDSHRQKRFQINQVLTDSQYPIYSASPVEEPGKTYFLYVGSNPSQLETAWEDMNSWYQVQRQIKVLTSMRQKGLSGKHLPQLVSSGRIIHPGQCTAPNSKGNCTYPLCGTPVLVTSPFGQTLSDLIRNGLFGPQEALRCCHDCLSALASASSAGIRHGDIRPDNVIRVSNGLNYPYFVLIGWGHAILEEKDRPVMNLYFSSSYALLEGKLCAASDAESLVYLIYFSCGGDSPELDSVEGAIQWREESWSRRAIQQKLGDISAVLKAFADYVDSLCGTPYAIDYEIWLRRFRRTIGEDHGKEIVLSN
ncbi:uncharacterized protein LOC109728283 [Ananas comosus]|uniref:Uncharacterized protein LOC109728283 n=1 Tax=Ananas comosus TaxID=4615 RepID=A0A6P5H2C8_ANACO|nr:uncharacterized protein LOC109728283 [Ananas comosus]